MTSPGQAIAEQLSGGVGDVLLIIGALAVLVGMLVLWHYVKNAETPEQAHLRKHLEKVDRTHQQLANANDPAVYKSYHRHLKKRNDGIY